METIVRFFLRTLFGFIISIFFIIDEVNGQVNLVAVPDVYYCEDEAGVTLAIENSEDDVQYRLQRLEGGIWVNRATRTGNGGTVNFFGLWHEASYRLQSIPSDIVDVIKIEVGVFDVEGGGSFCSNAPEDIFIFLSDSEDDVIYTLIGSISGAIDQLQGTNNPLTFGPYQVAQTYTIEAESDVGGCMAMMNGSAEIIIFTAPIAGFTTVPLGPPNGCSEVTFEDDTQTPGGAAIVSYEWDFNSDGIFDTTLTPPFNYNFPAYGTGTQNFDVTLKVTDEHGCEDAETKNITVNQRPHPGLTDPTNFPQFAICDGSLTLNVVNSSLTAATNISYTIEWGYGPTDTFDNTFTNASHTYPFGSTTYPLKFTVVGPTCTSDTIINVFIGSNPDGGITVLGGTLSGCAPFPITFLLTSNVGQNTPGTTYTFDFGDGTPTTVIAQDELPVPNAQGNYEFPHQYNASSCGLPGNQFIMSVKIKNPCDELELTQNGIRISKESQAVLEPNVPNNEMIFVCAGQPYNFNASPGGGCFIFNSNNYTEIVNYKWDFFNDGSFEQEGDNITSVNFTFPNAGIYEVRLKTIIAENNPNNCLGDEVVREVCVMEVPTPDFTLPDDEVCLPYTLIPENNTTFQFCGEGTYFWEIAPGVNGDHWELAPGSTLNDFEPEIIFNEPDNYQIRLRVEVRTSDNDYCGGEWTDWVSFTVKDIPEVELKDPEPILSFCGAIDYNFQDSVVYDPTFGTIVQYEWLVDGVFASNLQYPVINFPGPPPVTYSVEVRASNECGWSYYLEFEVLLNPEIQQNVIWYEGDMDLCEGMTLDADLFGTNELIGPPFPPFDPLSGGDGTYTYQWYHDLDDGNGFVEIDLATDHNLVYTEPLPAGLIRFRRVVESGGCVSESNIIEFDVTEGIENNTITNPDPQHICLGDAPDPLIGEDLGAGYTYLWEQSAECTNIWLPAMGTNDLPDYDFPVNPSVTTCYHRVVNFENCESISDPVFVYVYGDVENNTINLSNPDDSEICDGEDPDQINGSIPNQTGNINPDPFSYLWQQTDNPASGNWVDAQGTNNLQFYDPPALSQTTYYHRIATASAPAPAGCNTSISNVIEIIVHPNPVANAGDDEEISWGDTYNLDGSATGGSGNYTYLWEPEEWIDGPNNIQNPVTIPLTSPPDEYIFTLIVTDITSGCTSEDEITITFSSGALEITCTAIYPGVGKDFSVCLDDPNPIELTADASGGSENFTYVWETPTGPATGKTILYDHDGTPGTKNFTCTATDEFGNSVFCDIDIEVEPKAVITSPLVVNLCSGDFLNYTPTGQIGDVPITQFHWTTNPDPGGCVTGNTSSTAPGAIITDQLFNDDPLCVTTGSVSYIITPIGPPPNECLGSPSTLWVNVAPVPLVTNVITEQTVISGGPPSTQVNLNSNVPGAQFQWQVHSETCPPGVVIFSQTSGTSPFLPEQSFQVNGSQFTCEVTFEVIATMQNGALTCEGEPFYYTYIIQQLPTVYTLDVVGSGEFCDDGNSCTIIELGPSSQPGVNYQLFLNGAYQNGRDKVGNNNPLTWCVSEGGIYTVKGVNIATGITMDMDGQAEIFARAIPNRHILTVKEPNVFPCPPFTPQLTASQLDAVYTLWHVDNFGFEVAVDIKDGSSYGNGKIEFEEQTEPGEYFVMAEIDHGNIICEREMSSRLIPEASPREQSIEIINSNCENEAEILLEATEADVKYQLWHVESGTFYGNEVIGDPNGDGISLGIVMISGTFKILATKTGGFECKKWFEEDIIIDPVPNTFIVNPSMVCLGENIYLDDCEPGIEYYLYFDPGNVDNLICLNDCQPFTCNVGQIDFGAWADEGTYYVKAVNPVTNCSRFMPTTVKMYKKPTVYNIQPGGNSCPEVEISLDDYDEGAVYELWRDDGIEKISVAVDDDLSDGVNFGFWSAKGIYTVEAHFDHNSPGFECFSEMAGQVVILDSPEVFTLKPLVDNVGLCPPVSFFLTGGQVNYTYQLFKDGNNNPAQEVICLIEGEVAFAPVFDAGQYYVKAKSPAPASCIAQMDGTRTIHPLPALHQMNPSGAFCTNDVIDIKLQTSATGVTYQLYHIAGGNSTFICEENGTGNQVDFDFSSCGLPPFDVGVYRIMAVDDVTGCTRWMNGQLLFEDLPQIFQMKVNENIPLAQLYCPPVEIGLVNSEPGLKYILHLPDNSTVEFVSPGGPFNFPDNMSPGQYSMAGQYSVSAISSEGAFCEEVMDGVAVVKDGPDQFPLVCNGSPYFCSGDLQAITLQLEGWEEGVVYQLFHENGGAIGVEKIGGVDPLIWNGLSVHGAGAFYVMGKFQDDPDCESEIGSIFIQELPLPSATLNDGDTIVCDGDDAQVPIDLTGETFGWEIVYKVNGIEQTPVIFQPGDPQLITIPGVTVETVVTLVSVKYDGDPACEGAIDGDFTIKVDPLPNAFAGADQSICLSNPFTIPDADTLNISDFEWQVVNPLFGELQDATTLTPSFVPFDEAGNNFVEITLTANGAGACNYQQAFSTITLWVDSLPAAQAGEYDPMCATDQLQLNGQVQNFTNPVWEDLSGLGSFDDDESLSPLYWINEPENITEPTVVELTLSAEGVGECSYHSVTSTVLIEIIPTPQNLSAGNDSLICASAETFALTATALQYESIQWTTTGSGTFNDPSALLPEYEIGEQDVSSGSIELCMEVMPLSPCDVSVSDCMILYFEPLPEVELGADATICENASFNLFSNNVVALYCDSIIWYGGDGIFDDRHISMPEYTPGTNDIANGSVELCMTAFANSPCTLNDSVYNCITLYFQPLPEVNAGADQTVCESQLTLDLDADVTDFSSLEWVTYPENVGSFVDPAAQTTMFNLPDVDAPMLVQLILKAAGENECSSDFVSDTLMLLIEPLPEVFAGNDLAVCVSNHVQIKDADTASISDFLWEIISGNGILDDPERFDPTYYPAPVDAGTIVELKLTASGYASCAGDVAEDFVFIAVDGSPEVEMTQTSGTVCVSDPAGFTIPAGAVNLNNVSNYQWYLDLSSGFGQIQNSGTLTPTYFPHQLDAGKTVELKLAVKGSAACSTQVDTSYFQIKIGAKPVVYFEPQNDNTEFTMCKNQPSSFVDFTDFGYFNHHPDQIIRNRIWVFDETDFIDTGNETTAEYTFSSSGEHTVKLIVNTEIDGQISCTDSTTMDIMIYDSPVAGFEHERTNYCNGSLKFTDTSFSDQTTIVNWWWQFNNDYYSDLQHPEFEFESGGEKVISLQVTDARGCIGIVQDTIYIEEFFNFQISYTGDCFGEPIIFEVDESTVLPEGNSIVDFEWSFGDGSETLKLSNPQHIYRQAGSYEVMLKAIDATGCEKIKTINVHVPEPLEPDISFIDCSPSVTFTVFSNYSLESYEKWEWDFGDGTEMIIENPDSEFITHDYEVPGIYSVHLIVTDTLGCVDTVSVKNIRNECFEEKGFFLPNAFAPEHPNEEVKVFLPKGVGIEEFSLKIFDMWGNQVWETSMLDESGSPVEAWDGKYKNDDLPAGTYIYKAYAKFKDGTLWGNTIDNPNGNTENITGTILLIR